MSNTSEENQPAQTPSTPPTSYVTEAPQTIPGENFDPRIRAQFANEPKIVHTQRSPEARPFAVSDANNARHHESVRRYPRLNLSDGEFVVLDIKRHPIGLLLPVFATVIALLALIIGMVAYPSASTAADAGLPQFNAILLPATLLILLVLAGGAVAVWVYRQNQFYMTNESVIQEIQFSLFSRHEQTVSLGSIEDASFKQTGIMQTMLNYGTIRLSTEGEETTYRFAYVRDPRSQVATLNNAIEAFKNGRAVDPYEN